MSLHLEKCTNCFHSYMLEQFSPAFGPELTPGMIRCPHCEYVGTGNDRLVYVSHKLPRDVEMWPEGAD